MATPLDKQDIKLRTKISLSPKHCFVKLTFRFTMNDWLMIGHVLVFAEGILHNNGDDDDDVVGDNDDSFKNSKDKTSETTLR